MFLDVKISRKSEYAIRALVTMVRQPRSWSIQELSAHEGIPVKFLEQILLALRHAGLLSAKRGVGGGYSLRARPADVTVGRVIRIMDGPIAPVPCAAEHPTESCTCPDVRTCPLRQVMVTVREQICAVLDGRTLDELAAATDRDILAFDI